MNAERLLIVAKLLRMAANKNARPVLGFNMSRFRVICDSDDVYDQTPHHCNTAACIAGWTIVAFEGLKALEALSELGIARRAQALLGLDYDQTNNLFTPTGVSHGKVRFDITPIRAAQALEHLAKTGKISYNWSESA